MNDYQNQLNFFAFSDTFQQTQEYLERYWLTNSELHQKWLKIKNSIYFKDLNPFEYRIFKLNFEIIIQKGGLIFTKDEFKKLQSCMKKTGDASFVIIEDYDEFNLSDSSILPLRFKYKANISWHEMNINKFKISEGICYELFQRPVRNYFVYGDSGKWGKYVANDYLYPLDFIGFKKEYSNIFNKRFTSSAKVARLLGELGQ